jgi:hypothetical protein
VPYDVLVSAEADALRTGLAGLLPRVPLAYSSTTSSLRPPGGVRKGIGVRAGSRSAVWAPRTVTARSRSYFRLSRMRRWLRPSYTIGHDRPRDEEGEPP